MATGGGFSWQGWGPGYSSPPSLPASRSYQPLYSVDQLLRSNLHGPYKELLLGVFEHMDDEEYTSFQNRLEGVVSSGNKSIPRRLIMGTSRQGMPELILRYFPRKEALEMVKELLRRLPNMQLFERIQQFTHPEPGTFARAVLEIKHSAESVQDYIDKCQDIAAALDRAKPGMGNEILDEVSQRECVLAKYLLNTKELSMESHTVKYALKMASEKCKEELRGLGVIYLKVEEETLFTGELHLDPRTWDPVEVTQWVARTLLPRDPTATIPDLQLTGAEICTRPETWFTDKFPAGQGRVLYSDLQQRRDDTARQRKFGGREEEHERVVERASATFLVSAYLMSMVLTLLGVRRHREKAEHILQYLQSLIEVTKRRSTSEKAIHAGHFNRSWAEENIIKEIKEIRSMPSTEASVVFGSRAIAISSEVYSQVIKSVVEAMEVIGAPLEIQIKVPWWEWRRAIRLVGVAIGVVIGGAVVGAIAGPLVAAVLGFSAAYQLNQFITRALDALYESEKKDNLFKMNYLHTLILLPEVLREREMTFIQKPQELIERAQAESERRSIRDVESKMMEILPSISKLGPRIPPSKIQEEANFDYEAKMWLADDSIHNVNDTMIIAYAQFELRHLLRDVFVLGVIGSKHSGKNTMLKSVFPEGRDRAYQTKERPCDVKLFDGSNDLEVSYEGTLPVLLFPSGEGKVVDASYHLCTGVCSAFICVVEYVAGKESPDIGALARVEGLHVPVLLCVNKCGGAKDQKQASQILDRYKTKVSDFKGLRHLTEVVLTDFQITDRPAWLTGAEGVKYWIRDAIQNHNRYARNVEAEFEHVLHL